MVSPKLKLITANQDYPIKSQSLTGINIADKQYIPAGAIITIQSAANSLIPRSGAAAQKNPSHLKLLSFAP